MRVRRGIGAAAALAAVAGTLAACAVGPTYHPPVPQAPASFQAALPPAGENRAADASNWWRQFDDPLVAELVDAALATNPTLAQSLARLTQARARLGIARGEQLPTIDANGSASRSRSAGTPATTVIGTVFNRSIDASWEIDLFGAARKGAEAAGARVAARTADWQVAHVSLAAEVADTLLAYRACEATAAVLAQDLDSRQQTAQLTALKMKAGFSAAGDGALIDASAADARQALIAQRLECGLQVKALVDLTGVDEPALRARLNGHTALPRPRDFPVSSVPAQVLAQRPDIEAAERELAAAGADINVATANRYPRLSLTGSIGIAGVRLGERTVNQDTWSFGPVLNLPLFDGGRRRAEVAVAKARYDELDAAYRTSVRAAVRELEESLLRLDAAARREVDATAAARDYDRYFQATSDRFRSGNGSLFELEDARRTMLAARRNLIGVQRDRVAAWIALYKAAGGGWNRDGAAPAA